MDTQILEKIGLTNSETKVYLALLEIGSSSTGKIIEKAGVASSKIYEIMDKLMDKGLASFIIKSGVKHYEAAPPVRIMDYMREKEKEFDKQKEELEKILPQLEIKAEIAKHKSEATIFKGLKGGETAFRQMINAMKPDDEWIGFVVSFTNEKYFNLLTKLHRERSNRGLKARIIFNEAHRDLGRVREGIKNTKVKYLPENPRSPAIVNVAGNITLLNIMSEEVTVFMIDSKEVADSFRNRFEKLWDQEVLTTTGTSSAETMFNSMLEEMDPGEEYLVLGASWKGEKENVSEFFRDFHQKRIKKGVKAKFLFISGTEKAVEKNKHLYTTLGEVKFLPNPISEGLQINLYHEKVAIFVWRKKDPAVFLVNDPIVYQTFKSYYDTLWNQKAHTYEGQEDVEAAYNSLLGTISTNDEVLVFAAKPSTKRGADFNVEWNRKMKERAGNVRLLYYGYTEENKKRAEELKGLGCETKIIHTSEKLPISTVVAGNTVLNSVWEENPLTFKIENRVVAKSLRTNFHMLWGKETRVVKGLDAIQGIFEEMLEFGSCDFIGARGYFIDKRPSYMDKWEIKAEETGFRMRNIVDHGTKGHRITRLPFAQTKFTLEKEFANLSVFWIFGDKVVISNWTEEEPTAIIIENPKMNKMYREQFELLWKK